MVKRYEFVSVRMGNMQIRAEAIESESGHYVTYEAYQKLQEQLGKAEEVLEWFNKRYTGEEGIYARQYFKEKENK